MKTFKTKLTTTVKGVDVPDTRAHENHVFANMEELQAHQKSMHSGPVPEKMHTHILNGDLTIHEHDCIYSRTTGEKVEISMGPQGGGNVPANPFASLAQAGYLHAHPEKLGAKKLAEFDKETKGMKLPKRVKK